MRHNIEYTVIIIYNSYPVLELMVDIPKLIQ